MTWKTTYMYNTYTKIETCRYEIKIETCRYGLNRLPVEQRVCKECQALYFIY